MTQPNPTPSAALGPERLAAELAQQVSAGTLVRSLELLARRTTLRVGGPADLYVEPAAEADLARVLEFCAARALPWFVLGRGSNLLVRDGGFRGVVICLAQPGFCRIEVSGRLLHCGAGARLKEVAAKAWRHGLTGFEFLEGIPGSVGGGLRMNAGAMGGSTFDLVQSVRVMDASGQVRELPGAGLKAGYRDCPALKAQIAVGAVLHGGSDLPERIQRRMDEFSRRRKSTQPAASSAGCAFKNPAAIPAGRLIDELGLKGTRIGGASVSLEHGNFIVNDGSATAQDILQLIALIRERARTERGIELESEVEILGESAP